MKSNYHDLYIQADSPLAKDAKVCIDDEEFTEGITSISVDIEADRITTTYIEKLINPNEIDIESDIVWDFDTSFLDDDQRKALIEELESEIEEQ